MATVKVCTTAGNCIRCASTTRDIVDIIEKAKKAGKLFLCCGNQCVAIANIDIITEEAGPKPPDDYKRKKGS